jgi:hypothetical protein
MGKTSPTNKPNFLEPTVSNLYLIPSVADQTHLSSTHLSPTPKQLNDKEPIPTFQENRINPKQKSVLQTEWGSQQKNLHTEISGTKTPKWW